MEKDPKLQYFFSQKTIKPSTRTRYIRDLKLYCSCNTTTPTRMISQARADQVEHHWMDERRIPYDFEKFISYLQAREYSPYNVKRIVQTVKAFYHFFEIDTPKKRLKGEPRALYVDYEDLPQYPDMRKVISLSNTKYRSYFSSMASSGLNYVDMANLKIQDLISSVNYYYRLTHQEDQAIKGLGGLYEIKQEKTGVVPVLRLKRIKTGNRFITFLSPESLTFIIDYLEENPPSRVEDPIWRTDHKNTPLHYRSVHAYLNRLNEKAGWKDKRVGGFHYITTKSFRTFFSNELEDEGLNYRYIRLWMGHSQPGVTQNYFKTNAARMLEEYLKGVHRLTFLENLQIIDHTDEDVKELRERMEYLEAVLERERRFRELPLPRE